MVTIEEFAEELLSAVSKQIDHMSVQVLDEKIVALRYSHNGIVVNSGIVAILKTIDRNDLREWMSVNAIQFVEKIKETIDAKQRARSASMN